jgi:hypothetical protein
MNSEKNKKDFVRQLLLKQSPLKVLNQQVKTQPKYQTLNQSLLCTYNSHRGH